MHRMNWILNKDIFNLRKFFPPGENVVFDGQDYMCEDCDASGDPSQLPLHSKFYFAMSTLFFFNDVQVLSKRLVSRTLLISVLKCFSP